MLRALTLAALLLPLGAGAAPARVAGGTPVAFVAVENASQLVAVDLTTKRVVARMPVSTGPRNVTSTGDLRNVLVTSPPAGKVTLVDSFTQRIEKVFGGLGRPLDVAVEGEHAYVTDARRNRLVVIDLARRRISARIRVSARPSNVAAGDVALVTHNLPENFVTIVYLPGPDSRSVRLGRVRVAAVGAGDVSEQPDSAYAFVTTRKSAGVAKVDWGNRVTLWARPAGAIVHHLAFDYFHGGRIWVSEPWRGDVFSISSATGRPLRRLRGCPGAGPIALGGQAWVVATCRDAGALAIWDTRTWKRTLVPVGASPHGVAVAVVP